MTEERSSDPFPFLKIHRTVEALAISMSTSFSVSIAEAGWGLMQFWRRCADPREIERLYDEGKRHVFLDDTILSRRLLAAFGRDLDHAQLAEIGVLEKQEDGSYRVRGTSDFFKIIDESRRLAANGAKGGKAAASKRKLVAPLQPQLQPGLPMGPEFDSPATAKATQDRRDETKDGRVIDPDRSDGSKDELWLEIVEVYESFDATPPEMHPRERNDRLKTLLAQLPKEDRGGKVLAQLVFAALERFPTMKEARNPLGYLQSLLKKQDTRATLFNQVAALRGERATG